MWTNYYCCLKGNKPDHEVCQDFCYEECHDDIECIVVCDGASSGIKSEIGAEFISKYISKYFIDNFDKIWIGNLSEHNSLLFDLHQNIIIALSNYVVTQGQKPIVQDDRTVSSEELYKYCTTVQLLAIKDNKAISYKIGNGSIAYIDGNTVKLMFESTHDPLTAHITYKRTVDTLMNSQLCKFNILESIKGFILMSDGVDFEDGLYYNGKLTDNILGLIRSIGTDFNTNQSALEEYVLEMSKSKTNIPQDDISISLLIRDDYTPQICNVDNGKYDFSSMIGSLGSDENNTSRIEIDDTSKHNPIETVCQTSEIEHRIMRLDESVENIENIITKLKKDNNDNNSALLERYDYLNKTLLSQKKLSIIFSIVSGVSILLATICLCIGAIFK